MADELLKLSNALERPAIEIDGTRYEMASPGELSALATARIGRLGRKIDALLKLDEPTGEDEERVEAVLDDLTKIILSPVPRKVRATLTQANKQAAIEVFTTLLAARKSKLAGATFLKSLFGPALAQAMDAAKKNLTAQQNGTDGDGSPSSQDAPGSTAETPGNG